jgi:hypothetical protein
VVRTPGFTLITMAIRKVTYYGSWSPLKAFTLSGCLSLVALVSLYVGRRMGLIPAPASPLAVEDWIDLVSNLYALGLLVPLLVTLVVGLARAP